jgi:sulfane dehydrogenase subunit SoxC
MTKESDFYDRRDATTEVEQAIAQLGERITEAQEREMREHCECKQGMFALAPSRRQLFGGAGLVAAVGMTAMLPRAAHAKAPPGAVEYPVPQDPTKCPFRNFLNRLNLLDSKEVV